MNAVIYCRKSSANKRTPELSLNTQENICKDYCKKNNYNVIKVVCEIVSARDMNKMKKLNNLISSIQSNTLLLVADVSRFSRNVKQALDIISLLKNKGITIFSVSNNCNYEDASNKFLFRAALNQAEYESEQFSERINKSIKNRRRLGSKIGRSKFGYECYYENGIRYERKNNKEQETLYVIKTLKKHKYKLREILDHLNEDDSYKTSRWNKWTMSRLRNVLTVLKNN